MTKLIRRTGIYKLSPRREEFRAAEPVFFTDLTVDATEGPAS